jgi:hypothetical protein
LSKVEYRVVKEPDHEIDYVIRYYPGPGAKESNSRIQTYIRERRNRRKLKTGSHVAKQGSDAQSLPSGSLALSVVTANHHELASQLIVNFRVNPLTDTSREQSEHSNSPQTGRERKNENRPAEVSAGL